MFPKGIPYHLGLLVNLLEHEVLIACLLSFFYTPQNLVFFPLYLCFVWQSDSFYIGGTGAYIDDVIVKWDDGLFDIHPVRDYFGYIGNEDTTWRMQLPDEDDEVLFRLDWQAIGSEGLTPEFTIDCYMDSSLIYSERRQVEGSDTTVYTTIADKLWTAYRGNHQLLWVLDADEEVEESSEDNNQYMVEIPIEWNPPPGFKVTTPGEDTVKVYVDQVYDIHWEVTDSLPSDLYFAILLFWTADTTGLAANPDTLYDYHPIGVNYHAPRGEGIIPWNLPRDYALDTTIVDKLVWMVGLANDGEPSNNTIGISPGRYLIQRPLGVSDEFIAPAEYSLLKAYPNPFNRILTVDFSLAASGDVQLAAYDLAGRRIAVLTEGVYTAGYHSVRWTPSGIPGGVYMLRLDAGGRVFMQKVVYMP